MINFAPIWLLPQIKERLWDNLWLKNNFILFYRIERRLIWKSNFSGQTLPKSLLRNHKFRSYGGFIVKIFYFLKITYKTKLKNSASWSIRPQFFYSISERNSWLKLLKNYALKAQILNITENSKLKGRWGSFEVKNLVSRSKFKL